MEVTWPLTSPGAKTTAIDTFHYLPEHRVIICREHGYAVQNLARHLLDYHVYTRSVRKAVSQRFHGLPLVAPQLAALPSAYGPPVDGLAPPRPGFQCDEDDCRSISTRRATIAEHCNGHGWRSTRDEREHWTDVWVQSFSLTPGKQRWFIISMHAELVAEETERISNETQSQKDMILRDFDELRNRRKQELDVLESEVAKTDQTGWWKRTDWVTHLGKSNLRYLAYAARLPDKDEHLLKRIADLVDELIEQCVKGLASLPLELRRWLKSAQMNEVDQRPMGRLQSQDSQDRYAIYWKRLICYSLRVVQSEQARESEDPSLFEVDDEDQLLDDAVTIGPVVRQDKMRDARRLFPWRAGQRERAERLLSGVETGAESVMQALLDFSETFIFHKVYHKPFESPMLHFMAILGIDEENDRLRTANDYSYMLAGLMYCTRVVGLELLLPSERRSSQGEVDFNAFLQRRREFLADGSMSVVSNMISLLAYGKYIALNHGNAGAVFWERGDRVMKLHGARIVMEKFQEMVEASFVNNKQNRLESKWREVTIGRLLASRSGKKMHRDGKWHTRLAREYLRTVDKLRKLLLFCVHVTGGQPARGSEILSLRFKNGHLRDRNVFILDGYVMTVTFYNKTEAEWDIPKVVPRFLPWRVGQLLSLYLIYVQPFMEMLSVETSYGCGWSEYIWGSDKGPWETPKLTSILRQRTGEDIGHALGTLDFRHTAIGIGRKFVGDEFAKGYKDETGEVEEPEVEADDPLEISAGRGSAVGVNRYAVRSDIVRHLSQRNIETFRPLSESWHRFLGLQSRKSAAPLEGLKRKVEEARTPTAKKVKVSWKGGLMTPATMSVDVGSSIPAVRAQLPTTPYTTIHDPDGRANVPSSPLNRFGRIGVPSSPPIPTSTPDPPRPPKPPGPDLEHRERAVRKALGVEERAAVTYKSAEQEEALERIMNGSDSALAVVLPTGGGKTLLFTATACLDDPGMTIVVVPYRQLIIETLDDAKDRGIDAVEWRHDMQDPADIVFISADKLNNIFFDYSARMVDKGLVRRVFIDECHLAVTAHSWRPKMVSLARLRSIEAPMIMLTATLPLHMETDLEVTMRCELSLTLIRACTARKTTRYIVRSDVEDGKLMDEAIEVCSQHLARLQHKSKMVVYCRSKKECEDLAEALGCNFFYSGSPDNETVIRMWKDAGGCVVATTALGTGVNYAGIVLAVHVGMPYGLIDFAQESGRAGRGGEVVTSLVLLEKNWHAIEQAKRLAKRREWSPDEMAMLDFVNTDDCRRLTLGRYFDRKPAPDCDSGELERCDRCCSGVSDWARSERARAYEKDIVEEALDQMANGCPVCWVTSALGGGHAWLHDGRTCRRRRTVTIDTGGDIEMGEDVCDRFRATVLYLDGGKTCHACGISQKMCRTREAGRGGCQWPRIATAVVRLAMSNTIGQNIIRQAGYGGEMNDWQSYALWLGQPHRLRLWGELASNSMLIIKEFLVYCKQEMKGEPWDVESLEDEDFGLEDLPESTATGADEQSESIDEEGGREEGIEAIQWTQEFRAMGAGLDTGSLRHLIDGWKEQCVICKIRGRIARGHRHWSQCDGRVTDKSRMESVMKTLEEVHFADFSHCRWCYRSQAVCELWARSVTSQGKVVFKKKAGVNCVYGRWLLEAVAALLAFGAGGGLEAWKQQDSTLASFKEEMGRKHRRGEVEFSGLFMYFHRWA
ncbi:hypothetical protein LTR29_017851 [Friedmanniomyces endolithicus]|nr:hypothetical protein LTR29_017851 [Friedmanniomyces endolithicus]